MPAASHITNKFAVGDYAVTLTAYENTVSHFSVGTLKDAQREARRLVHIRHVEGKHTEKATARLIVERKFIKRQRYTELGPEIDLPIS